MAGNTRVPGNIIRSGSIPATASGDVVAYSSDIRLKENIKNIENALHKVLSINGVHYSWKDMVTEVGFTPSQKHEVGVLAQEIQQVLPEAVVPAPFDNYGDGSRSGQDYLTVKYDRLVPLLIEAIKEQQHQIQHQAQELAALKALLENK